jgi:hypothetical protein
MDSMQVITGAIVDSWVERPGRAHSSALVVLQVAPRGRPGDLLIVEAEASLLPDRGWLEDLGENMCHGSPVAAVGHLNLDGLLSATEIRLDR